ncbi:MAG TPA: thioredoxin domain-containing protein [Gemmatimonadaceae bacterium]|nr:thioredoxin domain-containing protein [Gemmatimonadaceae bacterium]
MRKLVSLVLMAAACRSSDGKPRGEPAGASASVAPAVKTATATPASASTSQDDALLERADRARIQGDSAAPVWLVEISDFQCPFCKQWHDRTYPDIQREFIKPGIVRMAYVNFPLGQHPHAMPAAEAAMCAAAQDKFWQMHDAIFNTQERWGQLSDARPVYDSLARSVGVDTTAYRKCLEGGIMKRLINADRSRGLTAGVGSTPTFFVGDQPITGAAPIDEFRKAIERARSKTPQR